MGTLYLDRSNSCSGGTTISQGTVVANRATDESMTRLVMTQSLSMAEPCTRRLTARP
ncbi:hypothetical protein D8666_23220 [Ochrobactrum soli]|uniref:hypothetical protein n=1 Tax=Brucella/Ochrobactrum group TaxID=2826938 RepID=UPI000D6910B6|nr:hypothetical protein [Ochrobactrum sp. C6C9]RLL64349.1 hypothetical protein D8666_23220 [[Ochrobactrum] soli]